MLKRMPAGMFHEWSIFARLEPFGSNFNEYLAAMLASVMAEIHRNRKKRGKKYRATDFMQTWGKKEVAGKLDTPDRQIAALEGYMRSMGQAMTKAASKPVELHPKAKPKRLPEMYDAEGRRVPASQLLKKKGSV